MTLTSRRHSSSSLFLASLLGATFLATTTVQAQLTIGIPGLFEVNLTVPDEIEDLFDDVGVDNNGNNATDDAFDFESLFNDLSDFLGESLENFTLPPDLQDLFELPNFDNFSFSFGGNCTICDAPSSDQFDRTQMIDDIPCSDWDTVATLGIPDGSEQCDLLRVAAAQSCGCPVPAQYATKTCPLCPEGETPTAWQASADQVLPVTCTDLEAAPAVDGDRTCDLIASFAPQCECQPGGSTTEGAGSSSSNGPTTDSNSNGEASGVESTESLVSGASKMMPMTLVAVGAILSAFLL